MSVVPSSSAKKGEVVLQPAFFTSSLYVHPLREDIGALAPAYFEAWTRAPTREKPFTVFKQVWSGIGWPWLHFKTLEDRSRDRFSDITMRLFLEKTPKSEPVFERVTALFALYLFFMTQPSVAAPHLRRRSQISVPMDIYTDLLELPAALQEPDMLPFRDPAVYTISRLLDAELFRIGPMLVDHAQNPRSLPREWYVNEAMGVLAGHIAEPAKKKKLGRPSKREKARRAREDTAALDLWLDETTMPEAGSDSTGTLEASVGMPGGPLSETAKQYRAAKIALLDQLLPEEHTATDDVTRSAVVAANNRVLERLRRIDALAAEKGLEVGGAGGVRTGLVRVERAVEELERSIGPGARAGVLSLSEGAGLVQTEVGSSVIT